MMKSKTVTALIPLLFVWLWSTGFVGARFGLPYIAPFYLLTLRFAFTLPFFLAIIWLTRARWLSRNQISVQILVGAILHGLYLGGVFYAISIGTPAGIAAIVMGIQPILTAIINRVLFAQSVSRRQTLGLVLGFAGLLAVILGSSEISGSRGGLIGLAALIVALLGITIATIIQKRYAGDTPLLAGTFWQYMGSLILVGIASLAFETYEIDAQWQFYAALFWMVVPLSTAAVLLLMYMIREGEVARVTSYFYLVPPVAVIQTWWLFGETLSAVSLVGCLVVVLGVALVVRK
jgi:drug/metabolite transporter (DMT)-like permease